MLEAPTPLGERHTLSEPSRPLGAGVVDDAGVENDFESTGGLVLILMDLADRHAKPMTSTAIRGCKEGKPVDPDLGSVVLRVLSFASLILAVH